MKTTDELLEEALIYIDTLQEKINTMERFKKPTDKQMIEFAIVFNEGNMDPDKISDMVGYGQMIVDRLYDNGDIMVKSQQEIKDEA